MACKNCPTIEPAEAHRSGLAYRMLDTQPYVIGLRGKRYSIAQPLVFRPHKPRGGWTVEVWMHGMAHTFSAGDPFSVFTKVKAFLIINEQPAPDIEIWLNLNLQWLERAIEKYQHVTRDDLMLLAIPNH